MSEKVIKSLEQRVADLESKFDQKVVDKPKRPPRPPSAYNTFMGDYMNKHKDPKIPHKTLFGDAVKAWNAKK